MVTRFKIRGGETTMDTFTHKANTLIEAFPYVQSWVGKSVVIKYGGNAMISSELINAVIEDIVLLKQIGINPVIVHGGGPDITNFLNKLNIKSSFYDGLRVTDSETMEIVQMVLVGKTNKEIVSLLNQKGAKAIGLCGIDSNEQYKINIDGKETDIGCVGKISKINSEILELLIKSKYIPVIAPIGVGINGISYNINADIAAGEIASAIKAEKLMVLTDVEGVKASNDSNLILSKIQVCDANKLIAQGIISDGMIPKVKSCIEALSNGVSSVHILDGRMPHCIMLEMFTDQGVGTMIIN